MPGIENPAFRLRGIFPCSLSSEKEAALALEATKMLQEIERGYTGADKVEINAGRGPISVLNVGDLHVGSLATDYDAIWAIRDWILSSPKHALVLSGDEIEGLKQQYMNTNMARTPLDVPKQIRLLRKKFLEPLRDHILCMVSGYWGHPGWVEDTTTVNPWIMMAEGLGIPIIKNGGTLTIRFANGHEQRMIVAHNPPGNSEYDPVYGLRKVILSQSLSRSPQGYLAAHRHVMGVAAEYFPGSKEKKYFIATGTAKGSNPEKPPDRFGIKLNRPWTDPLGQGAILFPRTRESEAKAFPFPSLSHGGIIFNAVDLLNDLESQRMSGELIEKVRKEVESAPEIEFLKRRSRETPEPYETKPAKGNSREAKEKNHGFEHLAPVFDSLNYRIRTSLPITLHLIANLRMGSASSGEKALGAYLQDLVAGDSHSLVFFLRNLIDAETAKKPDRKTVLDNFLRLIKPVQRQALALMLDGSLRRTDWKNDPKDSDGPMAPGSYLSLASQIPLIRHGSRVVLAIGPSATAKENTQYSIVLEDGLFQHGSISRPTYGLKRVYELYCPEKPGIVAGGHMPAAGTMCFFDRDNPETNYPWLVGTGWWAKNVDSLGKNNVFPGAMPGQAVILMPGKGCSDYWSFATADAEETRYLSRALLLWQGLEILGLKERVRKKK